MNLQADIKWIQSEIMKVTDPELISAFKSLLKYREKIVTPKEPRSWDEISEDEKADIEEGLKDVENGRVFSHEEVMANVHNRFANLIK